MCSVDICIEIIPRLREQIFHLFYSSEEAQFTALFLQSPDAYDADAILAKITSISFLLNPISKYNLIRSSTAGTIHGKQ